MAIVFVILAMASSFVFGIGVMEENKLQWILGLLALLFSTAMVSYLLMR